MPWNDNLRILRENHNMTQAELAKLIGTHEKTISRYETGKSEPTISTLIKYCEIFKINISEIINTNTTIKTNSKLREELTVIIKRIEEIKKGIK